MDTNKPLSATDEVAAAEAELRAAQERLEAAKAKLAATEASTLDVDAAEGSSNDTTDVDAAEGSSDDARACESSEADQAAEAFEIVEIVEVTEAGQGADTFEVVGVTEAVAAEVAADGAPSDNASHTCGSSDEASSEEGVSVGAGVDGFEGASVDSADAGSCGTPTGAHETTDTGASDRAAVGADGSGQGAPNVQSAGADKPDSVPETGGAPDWIPYSTPQTPTPPPTYGDPAQQPSYDTAARSVPQPPPAAPFGAAPASPYQPPTGYVAPGYGQPPHAGPNAMPPQQEPYGYQQPYGQEQYAQPVVGTKDHVAAGLLAIFLGWLGIHKFYLGYNTAGFIMLAVSIVGGIFTVTLATWVIWVIAVIEGILYLTKSQTEFEQIYVLNKKEWF